MGRPRLGKELKKPSDYSYDYPENREMGKYIQNRDRKLLASITGYDIGLIHKILNGKRYMNEKVKKYAELIMEFNKAKEEVINQVNENNIKSLNIHHGQISQQIMSGIY